MTAAFDTLAYAKRLKEAGFTDHQAEAQALALADAFKEGALATKQDIGDLRHELKQDIADLRHGLREVESALKARMDNLETTLGARVDHLEERTRGRFTLLQQMLGFDLALTVAVLWLLLRQAGAF
jgi:DNA polymerase III epsilon subunit-like protein